MPSKKVKLYKVGAIAAVLGMCTAEPAFADNSVTNGGLKITSEYGRFEGIIGGRIQYDYATIATDKLAASTADGGYLRRAYITLQGKLFGYMRYKLENDFANSGTANKDIWIGADLPAGAGLVRIGHM
jgi:phosphate-selective porin